MKDNSLSSKLSIIQPILTRFLKERKEIAEIAKREGKVPKELCELCNGFVLQRTKTIVRLLKEDEQTSIVPFLKWIRKNKITSIRGQFYKGLGSIDVEARGANR